MSHTLESEAPSHFVVNDGKSSFRVPKAGLSEGMLNKIRAYGQKMAEGGGVEYVAPDAGVVMPDGGTQTDPAHGPSMPVQTPMGPRIEPSGSVTEDGWPIDPRNLPVSPITFTGAGPLADLAKLGVTKGDNTLPSGVKPRGVVPQALVQPNKQEGKPPPPAKSGGGIQLPADASTAEFNASQNDERAAIAAGTEAAVARAKAEADALVAHGQTLKQAALEEKALRERAKSQADQAMSRVKAAQDEMARVNTKVDPGRFMASRGTAGKIATAIGLALGAFDPSGVNRAAQLLNQFIDRDIDAQKAESDASMRKAGAGVTAAQNLYSMQRQATGDDIAAHAAAKASMFEIADLKLKEIAASAMAPAAKAKALELSAQLQRQKAEWDAAAHKRITDEFFRKDSSAQGWAQIGVQRVAAGMKGAGGADAAKASRIKNESAINAKRAFRQAADLVKGYGTAEVFGPQEQRLNKHLRDAATALARLDNPVGQVTENEIQAKLNSLGLQAGDKTMSNKTALSILDGAIQDVDAQLGGDE